MTAKRVSLFSILVLGTAVAGCSTGPTRKTAVIQSEPAQLSGALRQGQGAKLDVKFVNWRLQESLSDPEKRAELEKMFEQQRETFGMLPDESQVEREERYVGEGFFLSKEEGCYNAFLGRDATPAQRNALASSRKAAMERVFSKLSAEQRQDLPHSLADEIKGIDLWIAQRFSKNVARAQLCPAGSGGYSLKLMIEGHTFYGTLLKVRVFEDKANRIVRMTFEGSTVVSQGGTTSTSRGRTFRGRTRYGEGLQATGEIVGKLSDEVREPLADPAFHRTDTWGHWSQIDQNYWDE